MTVMEFFGCTFLAFGPPFALFIFTIARDPIKIIILIASAFFWLLALLLSSLVYTLIADVFGGPLVLSMIFSVIFQELLRFVVYLLLRKAESGLSKVTDGSTKLVDNKHILAYVAGLGFGIMSGAFSLINLLAESVGPGTVGLRNGSDSPNFLIVSAITTLCFIFMNTAWGVIFFHALDHKNFLLIGLVFILHLAASVVTLFNAHSLYFASVLPNYIILILSVWVAFRVAGGRVSRETFSRNPVTLHVPAPPERVD